MGRKRTRAKITLAGNPEPGVHDRRAVDLLRNAQVGTIEIDDPFELGAKIIAFRSLRDDPLGRLHDRHQIDGAQFHAGRAYQRDFEMAERGPKAIDPSKEAVDGGRIPEPLTDAQMKAVLRLNVADKDLKTDGRRLMHDFLIHGLNTDQIAQVRRQTPNSFTKQYYGRCIRESLDKLAVVYGFAMKTTA